MSADDLTAQAVDALRVATLLHEQYRRDVAQLAAGSIVTQDERLLAMDENFRGVWTKLDQAQELLAQAGLDTSQYLAIRGQVKNAAQGYHVRHQEQLTPGGVQQSTTWSVSRRRITDLARGLGALRQLLPGVEWRLEQDDEVEAYLASQRSARRLLRPLGLAAAVISMVGAVVGVLLWTRPPDYGPHTRTINKLQEQLRADPCDNKKMVKLAEAYNRAGAHQTTLLRCAEFFQRCGEHRRLRWATLTAHKRLKQWDPAIAEATRLISAVPRDRDYRFWRAELRELKGDIPGALAGYRQTLALAPTLADVPVDLTELSAKLKRPCEGLLWLGNLVHHHPRDAKPVLPRLTMLRRKCTAQIGTGRAMIPPEWLQPPGSHDAGPADSSAAGAGHQAPPLSINGTAVRSFMVLQDALYVMLSARLATRLGLSTGGAPELILRTPEGFFSSRLQQVRLLALGGASARQVQVVVTENPPGDVECVVGQSFLTRFEVGITASTGLALAPFNVKAQRP